MDYTTRKDLEIFKRNYITIMPEIKVFDIVVDYNTSIIKKDIDEIENELNELSAIFEDKKNAVNLATLNDKEGMNGDILMIIYNNLVSADGNKKYEHLINELGTYNQLESIARIMAA
jgi:hypothetical protein